MLTGLGSRRARAFFNILEGETQLHAVAARPLGAGETLIAHEVLEGLGDRRFGDVEAIVNGLFAQLTIKRTGGVHLVDFETNVGEISCHKNIKIYGFDM